MTARINAKVEKALREAIGSVPRVKADEIAAPLAALDDRERAEGLGLAIIITCYVMVDACGSQWPAQASIRRIAAALAKGTTTAERLHLDAEETISGSISDKSVLAKMPHRSARWAGASRVRQLRLLPDGAPTRRMEFLAIPLAEDHEPDSHVVPGTPIYVALASKLHHARPRGSGRGTRPGSRRTRAARLGGHRLNRGGRSSWDGVGNQGA
jgi:hypothetical protein